MDKATVVVGVAGTLNCGLVRTERALKKRLELRDIPGTSEYGKIRTWADWEVTSKYKMSFRIDNGRVDLPRSTSIGTS